MVATQNLIQLKAIIFISVVTITIITELFGCYLIINLQIYLQS